MWSVTDGLSRPPTVPWMALGDQIKWDRVPGQCNIGSTSMLPVRERVKPNSSIVIAQRLETQ